MNGLVTWLERNQEINSRDEGRSGSSHVGYADEPALLDHSGPVRMPGKLQP